MAYPHVPIEMDMYMEFPRGINLKSWIVGEPVAVYLECWAVEEGVVERGRTTKAQSQEADEGTSQPLQQHNVLWHDVVTAPIGPTTM